MFRQALRIGYSVRKEQLHNNMSRRDLVIGAVRGYSFQELAPFVLSLKNTSFDGEIVLLWNSLDQSTRLELDRHGVRLVHFDYRGSGALNSWSRFWPFLRLPLGLPVGDALRRFVYRRILNLAFVRYVHSLDYLVAHEGQYRNIFLSDVRDVIFQDNPFRSPLCGEILAFLEEEHMVYGREPMNDGWISTNYGPGALARLTGFCISCCGTVMASEAGMIRYLRAFVSEVRRLHSLAHGADTSVHNMLVREVLSDRIRVKDNHNGPVSTVNPDVGRFRVASAILDRGGRPVPVLHQYDRAPELKDHLLAAFGSK